MDDLVQFLRDRLGEDEQTALAAALGRSKFAPWRASETDVYTTEIILAGHAHRVADTGPTYSGADGYEEDAARAAHIARHDPARVLREVEAKREIVKQADLYLCDSGPGCGYRTKHGHNVLRLLALPYSDHPDYRDAWRP
ncbi:DUF6221 family protein [Streptomyces sp. LN549]|uniref:DUF6221 family protein n=1 Tax=Streptomyces sp. LN549 TaxID=3112979 RepID=UPI0037222D1B